MLTFGREEATVFFGLDFEPIAETTYRTPLIYTKRLLCIRRAGCCKLNFALLYQKNGLCEVSLYATSGCVRLFRNPKHPYMVRVHVYC